MNQGTQNFSSEKSHKKIKQLTVLIRERGSVTKLELMALAGLSEASARAYLHHMVDIDVAYVAQPAQRHGFRQTPGEWAVHAEEVLAAPRVDIDDFPRRVIVRQQWEPNHVRMTIDCLLFGVPKVLQGVAIC